MRAFSEVRLRVDSVRADSNAVKIERFASRLTRGSRSRPDPDPIQDSASIHLCTAAVAMQAISLGFSILLPAALVWLCR